MISLPPDTKMFQFSGCASSSYKFRRRFSVKDGKGCPIRISPDQCLLGSSPRLFAACYVLHRLFESRHPPHASVTVFLFSFVRKVPTNRNLADNRLTTENFRLPSSLRYTYIDNIALTSPARPPFPVSASIG